jgi:plastocyanin
LFDTVKNGQLWGNPKVNSGGGAWYPPAVDTSNGTTYWGIGNPAPFPGTKAFPNGSSRPGPNLYSDSELALDSSGKQVWSMQAPGGINSPMSAAGDTLLVPVGLGTRPMLLALALGATGTIPSASPSVTPTNAPSPSPSENTDLQISTPDQGDGILFDTSQLTAPAGARVSLTYTNESAIPHDWHLFDGANASAPSIASTKIQAGPNDAQDVSFTVPSKPGRYYFQCDVHPTLMNGFLIVH